MLLPALLKQLLVSACAVGSLPTVPHPAFSFLKGASWSKIAQKDPPDLGNKPFPCRTYDTFVGNSTHGA